MSDAPTLEEAAELAHIEAFYPPHVRVAFAALMALTEDERTRVTCWFFATCGRHIGAGEKWCDHDDSIKVSDACGERYVDTEVRALEGRTGDLSKFDGTVCGKHRHDSDEWHEGSVPGSNDRLMWPPAKPLVGSPHPFAPVMGRVSYSGTITITIDVTDEESAVAAHHLERIAAEIRAGAWRRK